MMNIGFEDGGWGMWPTLLFGLFALGAASVYAFRPERRIVPLVVSSSVLTLVVGALGFVMGIITSIRGARGVADHGLVLLGAGEAANCVALALTLVAVSLMATTIGAVRVARAST